jgi:GNAT superfamily N-acetyltransferase
VSLIAFTGHGQPHGAVLDQTDVAALDVVRSDQLGAVRWYPATGEIDQIYVTPSWRRRSIGTVLVIVGTTLSVARDWPRFWTDGQRTELGERMRAASEWGHRAAELTNIAPPMTPPDDLR